jgi:hypothetical protein
MFFQMQLKWFRPKRFVNFEHKIHLLKRYTRSVSPKIYLWVKLNLPHLSRNGNFPRMQSFRPAISRHSKSRTNLFRPTKFRTNFIQIISSSEKWRNLRFPVGPEFNVSLYLLPYRWKISRLEVYRFKVYRLKVFPQSWFCDKIPKISIFVAKFSSGFLTNLCRIFTIL